MKAGPWSEVNDVLPNALSPETIQSLESLGFPTMTPVQKNVIPLLLNYKDVAVEAVTGSGKTLAFLVPTIEFLKKYVNQTTTELSVLILVPTRALAQQILDVFTSFIQYHPYIKPQLLIGGSSTDEDLIKFKENPPNTIIATPGKLHEFITLVPSTTFRRLELFIVDEADQILKDGNETHLTAIFQALPKQRRTGLFSATLSQALLKITHAGMRNPVFLRIKNDGATPVELVNFYSIVDPNYKLAQLVSFIENNVGDQKAIVFVLTGAIVEYFTDVLHLVFNESKVKGIGIESKTKDIENDIENIQKENENEIKEEIKDENENEIKSEIKSEIQGEIQNEIEDEFENKVEGIENKVENDGSYRILNIECKGGRQVFPLFGQMNQSDRDKSLSAFRDSAGAAVLIATDIAARGIDIPNVEWIIQFDAPQDPKMFVHRVGRTARIGNTGNAIIFLREAEDSYVDYLANEKVAMQEASIDFDVQRAEMILNEIRSHAMNDREFCQKGMRAMASYARAYGEHKLKLLLNKKKIDFVALGNSFGLVRLPVMPELKDKKKVEEYNTKYAEFNEPYKNDKPKAADKPKKKKKQLTADEENALYQQRHRKGGFRPHKK